MLTYRPGSIVSVYDVTPCLLIGLIVVSVYDVTPCLLIGLGVVSVYDVTPCLVIGLGEDSGYDVTPCLVIGLGVVSVDDITLWSSNNMRVSDHDVTLWILYVQVRDHLHPVTLCW